MALQDASNQYGAMTSLALAIIS